MAFNDRFKAFATWEELQDYLRRKALFNNLMIQDWQRRVRPGDYVVRFWQEPDGVYTLYYEILDPLAPDLYDPDDMSIPDTHRLVRGYSQLEPAGELGVEHIASFDAPIPREIFDIARELGWPNLVR